MSFWTDAAVLGGAGTPSVLFGPGGAGLHSVEEYVRIADVLACRDALVRAGVREWQSQSAGRADVVHPRAARVRRSCAAPVACGASR